MFQLVKLSNILSSNNNYLCLWAILDQAISFKKKWELGVPSLLTGWSGGKASRGSKGKQQLMGEVGGTVPSMTLSIPDIPSMIHFYGFFRIMWLCPKHDFKLLTSLSTITDTFQPVWARLCWTGLGLWACGYKEKLCCVAYDHDTLTTSTTESDSLTTSTTESSDKVTTYGLPDEYLHCWRQTLPLPGSAKFSASGIHVTSSSKRLLSVWRRHWRRQFHPRRSSRW